MDIVIPAHLFDRIEAWRGKQNPILPRVAAMRELMRLALDVETNRNLFQRLGAAQRSATRKAETEKEASDE